MDRLHLDGSGRIRKVGSPAMYQGDSPGSRSHSTEQSQTGSRVSLKHRYCPEDT